MCTKDGYNSFEIACFGSLMAETNMNVREAVCVVLRLKQWSNGREIEVSLEFLPSAERAWYTWVAQLEHLKVILERDSVLLTKQQLVGVREKQCRCNEGVAIERITDQHTEKEKETTTYGSLRDTERI